MLLLSLHSSLAVSTIYLFQRPSGLLLLIKFQILVAHSLLDVTYVVLPLIFVWNLRLPSSDKIALTLLLGLGLFAAVCSMIKISKTSQLGKTQDITWEFTDLSIWNVVELNVGIVVGSVPPMRQLLRLILRQTSDTLGLSSASKNQTSTGGRRSSYILQKNSRPFELHERDAVISRTMGESGESKESVLKSKGGTIVHTNKA